MKDKNLLDNSSGVKDAISGNNHDGGLKGNVALVGFDVLDESEQEVVKKIVSNYIKKMSLLGDYHEMKISLRQHKHGKTFKHEVNAFAIFGQGKFESDVTEWNLYIALSMVCDKILAELEHKIQKSM
ncbi:MAG: hypothetical protein KKE23_00980 [Nanoarchaeota archaeon]|nr:hypothetical protein [Nanoarchaeota archaeon]